MRVYGLLQDGIEGFTAGVIAVVHNLSGDAALACPSQACRVRTVADDGFDVCTSDVCIHNGLHIAATARD